MQCASECVFLTDKSMYLSLIMFIICVCVRICAIRAINDSCRITEEFNMSPELSDYICADEPDAAHAANYVS